MRFAFILFLAGFVFSGTAEAATGKLIKVLPQFMDANGRVALSPSLFERDAYQADMRLHPEKRGGIRFAVQWKTRKTAWAPLRIQVQLLGTAEGNLPKQQVLEKQVQRSGFMSKWAHLDLTGQQYVEFGEVTAWRVTLWEGNELLAEQKSFLW